MAPPASSPIPMMMMTSSGAAASAASSPMSYFSYRGAGLEMADDEEEDESTTTASFLLASQQGGVSSAIYSSPLRTGGRVTPLPVAGASLSAREIPPHALLPSHSSPIGNHHLPDRPRNRLPLVPVSTSSSPMKTKEVRGAERSRHDNEGDEDKPAPPRPPVEIEGQDEGRIFEGIEAIPHCDDDVDDANNRSFRTLAHPICNIGEQEGTNTKTAQHEHLKAASSSSRLGSSRDEALKDCSTSSGNVLPNMIGSRDGSDEKTDPSRTEVSSAGTGRDGGNSVRKFQPRVPVAAVMDDDVDDEDSDNDRLDNPNAPVDGGGAYHHHHHDDDDDDFIKSFLDQAVDAPCQRLTVAPCMADLMDRQMDLFMRCRQPLEFLSLFRDDVDPDDELQRTWHGSDSDGPYPLLHAVVVAPGAYVLPTSCEYCGSPNAHDCDPTRCQRPRLFFAKKRPPFANEGTAHTFFDPSTDDAY